MAARLFSGDPRNWAIRTAPPGVPPYYLSVEIAAVVLTVVAGHALPGAASWARFGGLVGIAFLQTELSRGTEQIRRYFAGMQHINMTSVWIGAGALLLPPVPAALLVILVYAQLWLRVWRPMTSRPAYRVAFSASTMVVATLAVPPVLRMAGIGNALAEAPRTLHTLTGIVAAILAFTAVNALLVMAGLKLHSPDQPFFSLIGTWADNALEIATLCLGGVTAILMLSYPAAMPLMLLPVIVLHRGVLMRQLQELATRDAKTGLLTDPEWRNRAAGELARAQRRHDVFGVLIVDLDNFKRINDRYGHLAGDAVLRAVAGAIRVQVRDHDPVGRFGGEEFAVLLPEVREAGARAIAERIRHAVTELKVVTVLGDEPAVITGLSASIGVAAYPDAGDAIDRLVHAADMAMYRAKSNGRNQVVGVSEV